ncbi:MAG: DUF6340 family protein [Bacteroidota bacterium]|nr:DUF6340 family protein [Bacteroidota bacterium]
MKNVFLFLLIAGLWGCSSTNIVTMSVIEPAPVELPSYMKRIGIINRNLPSEKDKILDKVDQILSVEGKNLDKEGALESIVGLSEELKKNSRINEVLLLETVQLENPGFGIFPGPLSWNKIAEICMKHQLNGLFILKFYDTDATIDYSTKQVMLKNSLGIELPVLEHHASARTIIKTGWRIYDNNGKNIIDEYIITKQVTTAGSGINPVNAVAAITGRKEAVKTISYDIGRSYALNILPYQIRVSRDYYIKGSDNFEIAKRRAQTGNWNGAAELWEKEINNPKAKIAGRAYYNMAIISEINGNLDLAINWSQKSYEDYDNKLGLRYTRILENRRAQAQVLERQQQ